MIPLSDGIPAHRYELPDLNAAISHTPSYPRSVKNAYSTTEPVD